MANDRLYMECLRCGARQSFLTYWGAGEFHDVPYNTRDGEKVTLAEWMQEHARGCHLFFRNDLAGFHGFRLSTDSDDAKPEGET